MTLSESYALIQNIDLELGIRKLERELSKYPKSSFNSIIGCSFKNDVPDLSGFIIDFHAKMSRELRISAVYLEMNAFTVNTECWYADLFGFLEYGGREDWDWLCEWQTPNVDPLVLRGMNAGRLIFQEDYLSTDSENVGSKHVAELLVVLRFNEAVALATKAAKNTRNGPQG